MSLAKRIRRVPDCPPVVRCHAQELDLGAVRAVMRASEEGWKEGHTSALRKAEQEWQRVGRTRFRVLVMSVVTALLLGFSAGVWVGARAPHAAPGERGGR